MNSSLEISGKGKIYLIEERVEVPDLLFVDDKLAAWEVQVAVSVHCDVLSRRLDL